MLATVFVTQIPHKMDGASKKWIPAINIAPASQYGKVRIMIPFSPTTILDTSPLVKELDAILCEYDYEKGDSILMTGDPAVIAVASAVLAEYTDKFRILKWERTVSQYFLIDVRLPCQEKN